MEFYHVLNRGVEKRPVVLDDGDRMRFVQSLYIFNDRKPTPNAITQKQRRADVTKQREQLVVIHAWCLMDNHYHILLSPVEDDLENMSLFMKKLNGGYAKFFNEKYERSGYLWQGKYKKIHIQHDAQFLYIPYYIHLNPLDFKFKEWRTGDLKDVDLALQFLDNYRWSSWQDYTAVKNFPSVMNKDVLSDILINKNIQVEQIQSIATDITKAQKANALE